MCTLGEPACSPTHFYRMWKSEWPNATCQRWNKFTKCSKCVTFDTMAAQTRDIGMCVCTSVSVYDIDKLACIHRQRARHEDEWRRERQEYYHHQDLARMYPDK